MSWVALRKSGWSSTFRCSGIVVFTGPLHLKVLDHPDFRKATHDIHYVERWLKSQAG